MAIRQGFFGKKSTSFRPIFPNFENETREGDGGIDPHHPDVPGSLGSDIISPVRDDVPDHEDEIPIKKVPPVINEITFYGGGPF